MESYRTQFELRCLNFRFVVLGLIVFSFFSKDLQAQYLPEVGSYWYYKGYSCCGTNSPSPQIHIEVVKDTVINNLPFKVLGFITQSAFNESDKLYLTESDGKVSFFENDSLHTVIDYEANVGDTLLLSIPATWQVQLNCCSLETNRYNIESLVVASELLEENGQTFRSITVELDLYPGYEGWTYQYIEKLNLPEFFEGSTCCLGGFPGSRLCYNDSNGTVAALDVWDTQCAFPLSIGSLENSFELKLYPNPTSSVIQIDSKEHFRSMKVFSLDGRFRFEVLDDDQLTVDLSGLEAGIYFVELISADGLRAVQKVVKR